MSFRAAFCHCRADRPLVIASGACPLVISSEARRAEPRNLLIRPLHAGNNIARLPPRRQQLTSERTPFRFATLRPLPPFPTWSATTLSPAGPSPFPCPGVDRPLRSNCCPLLFCRTPMATFLILYVIAYILSLSSRSSSCHCQWSMPPVISSEARRAESRNLHAGPGHAGKKHRPAEQPDLSARLVEMTGGLVETTRGNNFVSRANH